MPSAAPAPGPTECAATRPTPPAPSATTCAAAESAPSYRNPPTRSGTASAAGPAADAVPVFDAQDYRGRNVIERSFDQLKQWRGTATPYDELATLYRAAILIHDTITWTKALPDTP